MVTIAAVIVGGNESERFCIMASVDIISFTLRDEDPDRKSMPLYVPAGNSVADLQSMSDAIASGLNTVTGLVVESSTLTKALTLPNGLRTTPVAGYEVQRGALLGFDVTDSDYRESIFVPGWLNAGFAGNNVVNSGNYANFIAAILAAYGSAQVSDKDGNLLAAFLSGRKRFRK